MSAPVAVGYDGSDHARAAVDYAVAEAKQRNRPLLIVHAAVLPFMTASAQAALYWPNGDVTRQALDDMMRGLVDQIAEDEPNLSIRYEVIDSVTAGATMVEVSRECELMVVGSRGRGGFTSLLLGSTSTQLAAHAHCPVIVIRDSAPAGPNHGSVVVGIDGSSQTQAVLEFAFETASLRRAPLVAIHAWRYPVVPDDAMPLVYDPDELATTEGTILAEALAGWQERFPDVNVERKLMPGKATTILLEQARGAKLLVVGSRGRGGFASLLLGSTSGHLLHHAETCVAVVRTGEDQ